MGGLDNVEYGNNQSFSPLAQKIRESDHENAYLNHPMKGLLPYVTKNNMRESYEPNYENLKTGDAARTLNNASFMTCDNNTQLKSRNSIMIGEHSFENYIKNDEFSSLSSFTQVRNYIVKNDIEKYNAQYFHGLNNK